MARAVLFLIGCITGIQACSARSAGTIAGTINEAERASIAAAIEQRVDGYFEAARRQDVQWLLGFWANIPEFVIAGDGEVKVGYEDGIATPTRQWFAGLKTVLVSEHMNGHAYVLARDAASYTTEFRWSIVRTAGDTVTSHGAWTYVFKKLNGEWRVVQSAGTHLGS